MKLERLCAAANISCPTGRGDEVAAICTDSRTVVPDSLFICIPGIHTDGHTCVAQAVANGARWVLTQEGYGFERLPDVVYLQAPDTRRASAILYDAFYGFPSRKMKFVGVTGTNGKTTVTHLLRSILEANLSKCGLIGTVGCESAGRVLENRMYNRLANMTTPDPSELYRMLSEMADDGVEYVLMEVTSHALALGKLEPLTFEAAIFTNLTPEHLDFHHTMDAYADAKAELFAKSKLSILNLDSPYASRMRARAAGRFVTCSVLHPDADYRAEAVQIKGKSGVQYVLRSDHSRMTVQCGVPGAFNVMNSMQAAICAAELGVGAATIKIALASVTGVRGRMERMRLGVNADFSVIIDYAHTPDALEKLLRTARDLCERNQRVVLVFGCGGDRDRGKRPLMGAVASRYADDVIVTSDNSRSEDPETIIREILEGMDPQKPCRVIPDRKSAIREAVLTAKKGDLILLAGKGHEEYEITKEGRKPFFEREIVLSAFAERQKERQKDEGKNRQKES